ncbi:peptidoglycan DD-metalloendopeptidase family protein [Alteromonas pelagimontana]|uniref:Peptidoglycan DD-metalloendopeptidase family protein n=1 Tax=Alteromonas pelagimontana TaxID=1858656 RepID=A0A6M4MB35_9ALTE|nr:peptidoglycan DD-metalloendopeptidase family protein [Alteromonas pelagimontana]QJR80414.1 peptidoglycan DD-metalloendopeptidase family protein [Alteromonas pelagimontana]
MAFSGVSSAYRALQLLIVLGALGGCSSDHRPAPVVLLNSQPDVADEGYSGDTYTVKSGDTLFAIAWYTGNDYRDIARYNNLRAPYSIYPGQTLRVVAPRTAKSPSSSAIKGRSGPTSTKKSTSVVDPQNKQAYGESENNVNNQRVKAVENSAKNVAKQSPSSFPATVQQWVWPAKGKLVGTFSKVESGSKGIEISAPHGTRVNASAAGKVVYSGNALRGYGNLIIIKHTDSFLSAYAHNDTNMVKEQQWVTAGQQIATMGKSGTDSVKLHFEVRYRGKSLDPLRYLPKAKP